jgi:hypothetical protein
MKLHATLFALVLAGLVACGGAGDPATTTVVQPAPVSASHTAPSRAEPPPDGVAGPWLVTWLENMTVNELTLDVHGREIAGRYVSDDGEVCPVRGEVSESGTDVSITVTCGGWDVIMEGVPAQDEGTMEGRYLAYGHSRGRFTMARP